MYPALGSFYWAPVAWKAPLGELELYSSEAGSGPLLAPLLPTVQAPPHQGSGGELGSAAAGSSGAASPGPGPGSSPGKRAGSGPEQVHLARWGSEILQRDRETAREVEMQDRLERLAADIALKYIRADHCLKYIRVCVDTAILQEPGGYVLLDVLNSLESEYSIEPQSVPSTITWRRQLPQVILDQLSEESKHLYKSKEENQILVLLSPNYFLNMVWLHKQKMKGVFMEDICENFDSFIMRVLGKQFYRKATLAVIGLDTYTREKGLYSPVKRQLNSENTRDEDSESWVSKELGLTCADLDEVQVALQLQTHTTVWFLENWQQFADHIATLTKAIARSPFKKQSERMTFSFCPDGTWSTGVKVDKDGKGLLKLWKKQLQQLNRITQPVAMAIAQAYPTPQLLQRAYRHCTTEWEKQNLLSEVKVQAGGKRVDRRVGPDISRRLYIFMTSENADIVLDKSG
ncbi:probable crossover junction endonuclease EME2 isoform X1 [Amblyraja radiata]|uniref:probable crossover junction endonuclease EME2 isoform X1 n=1 Tax=Amblyraja radiata TaxID=386614 RepID=UPI00140416BB|nr:probable crossover junction endonuclease EME2 isoform X1 [Amblyraja radiata]